MNIMHTMASDACTTQAPKRRFYSLELKLQVVGACSQPGASIAGVALQHGINANIVHRWLREHSQGTLVNRPQTFVPVTLSAVRRLHQGHFVWPQASAASAANRVSLSRAQLDALVLGLPWSRIGEGGIISVV